MAAERDLNLLDELLGQARRAGADAAEAMLVEHQGLSATHRLGRLEAIERAESADLGLRLFLGRRQAIVSTSDLDPAALARLVEQAVAIARALPEDPFVGLAEPDEVGRDLADLDLDDGVEPGADALAARAAAAEDSAWATPGITNSEGATASWSRTVTSQLATNGFRGHRRRSRHGLSVAVIAAGARGMERDYDYASVVRAASLPDPAALGRRAAERAVRRLDPIKVRSKAVPVVFEPRVAGSLVGHLVTAISGPAVARGTTFLKDRLGERVMAPGVAVVDDPHRPDGLRSRAFDAEGIATRKATLVEDGVLTTWLLDCASARQLGLRTTGHASRGVSSAPAPAASNVYLAPGKVSAEDLIGTIAEGFYVTEMLGMGVSYVTGDYSRGASGFWIEQGRLGPAVSEVTVAGALPEMFRQLTPASDLEFRYGVDAPTLRIDGMTVAGQ
jgi:PmbA protein